MAELILFNKPFHVLSQFTDAQGRATLGDWIDAPGFYPAGRLDYDSEGLLLLTDDGSLQDRIAHPRHAHGKTYLVQVEGEPDREALELLRAGPDLRDGPTRGARARRIERPGLWDRDPPVRARRSRPTSWLELQISEGRNRQVRRMCAAVGFPVLRLVRMAIGPWSIGTLGPGEFRRVTVHLPAPQAKERGSGKIRSPRGSAVKAGRSGPPPAETGAAPKPTQSPKREKREKREKRTEHSRRTERTKRQEHTKRKTRDS